MISSNNSIFKKIIYIFLCFLLVGAMSSCQKKIDNPIKEEEQDVEDNDNEDVTQEIGDIVMSFTARVMNGYEYPHELEVFVSTDFSGEYDYEAVLAATWQPLNDRITYPVNMTDGPNDDGRIENSVNITDLMEQGKPFHVGFKYTSLARPPQTRNARQWRVLDYTLTRELSEDIVTLADFNNIEWTFVTYGEVEEGRGGRILDLGTLDFWGNTVSPYDDFEQWAVSRPIDPHAEVYAANCYDLGTCYGHDLSKSPTPEYEDVYIPEGFVETKDIVYFKADEQGSVGVIEKAISDYNTHIVGEIPGYIKEATSIEDLLDNDGNPLDWDYRMDIIHPETSSVPRPVFFIVATHQVRNMPRHTPFQQAFAKRGYVTVIIDHAYSPIDRILGGEAAHYSFDAISGVKAYTAAIRYLRANAEKYSIDPDRIGGMGHSKGSYAIARLSDPAINHESSEFSGSVNALGPQPNTEYPSHIQVGYQSMGNGTRRSQTYVNENYSPIITAVGKYDSGHWENWPNVVAAYAEGRSANWLGIPMLDRGHDMATGVQHDLGYVREDVVERFFSNYLEPDLPPNVLYVAPFNGYHDENVIQADQPVIVHFSPQMDATSVKNTVKIIDTDSNQEVRGAWSIRRKDTYFVFTPESGSFKGKNYKVSIGSGAKSIHGVSLGKSVEHLFSIN